MVWGFWGLGLLGLGLRAVGFAGFRGRRTGFERLWDLWFLCLQNLGVPTEPNVLDYSMSVPFRFFR